MIRRTEPKQGQTFCPPIPSRRRPAPPPSRPVPPARPAGHPRGVVVVVVVLVLAGLVVGNRPVPAALVVAAAVADLIAGRRPTQTATPCV